MSTARADVFNHSVNRANIWLADIGDALGTGDRRQAHRVLRSWLHTLRDRLTVEGAVKFGQQLPELLRGAYYDGWKPSRAPVKYNVDQYVERFATDAILAPAEVPATAAAITEVLADHMSPGQVDEALAELPTDLRAVVREGTTPIRTGRAPAPTRDTRGALEDRVVALGEAVRTLARGLEGQRLTGTGIDQAELSRAARLADEIVMAADHRVAS